MPPLALGAPKAREKRIKVGVRLRPFTQMESLKAGGKAAWTWYENTIYQQIFPAQVPTRSGGDRKRPTPRQGRPNRPAIESTLPSSYTFDYLYPPITYTEEVYKNTIQDAVVASVEGYHSAVFLYGQTGTGKTHTMQGTNREPGVIQLAVNDVFHEIASHQDVEFLVRVNYLEIYNERIYDLLAGGSRSDINIYEVHKPCGTTGKNQEGPSAAKDIVIKGLKEEIVLTTDHVLSLIDKGNRYRHMATTELNDQSSRSHVIFRMVIESQQKASGASTSPVRSATLNLVDLAGSESVRSANTTGQHQEEGRYINRSLLTLGHIIWKLSRDRGGRNKGKKVAHEHLPYRNSKLTRILQPSLSGRAQIAVVCTVSPAVSCLSETHNTLKFASRARHMRNRAAVNEIEGESAMLKQYRERVHELEAQLRDLQKRKTQTTKANEGRDIQVGLSDIEKRQKELRFAIGNIHRVILNSTPARRRAQSEHTVQEKPQEETFTSNYDEAEPEPSPPTSGNRVPLTTVLKTKYQEQLQRLSSPNQSVEKEEIEKRLIYEEEEEEKEAPWSDEQRRGQRELLNEFVRGLEIAEAEQETRLTKIEELEFENRRLLRALQTREDELLALKEDRPRGHTTP